MKRPKPISWWRALMMSARIDPPALDPNSSHPPLRANLQMVLDRRRFRAESSGGMLLRLGSFVRQAWMSLRAEGAPLPDVEPGSVLFVAFTANQRDAIEPVARRCASPVTFVGPESAVKAIFHRRRWLSYALAVPFLPLLIWRRLIGPDHHRASFAWAADSYWLSYGEFPRLLRWLTDVQPAALVLSNDHIRQPCLLREAAAKLGIPTVYVQHASVTSRFPPLKFDYALLDGEDAADKYARAAAAAEGGSSTRVALVGMPKADAALETGPAAPEGFVVGMCLSFADDRDRFIEALEAIAGLGVQVKVRPHPRMNADYVKEVRDVSDRLGTEWSSTSREGSFEFLRTLSVNIAGVSAITLESAMLGVLPITMVLNNKEKDWYGFMASGLCRQAGNAADLARLVAEVRDNGCQLASEAARGIARRYCMTLGTAWEGRSSELAASCVDRIALSRSHGTYGCT